MASAFRQGTGNDDGSGNLARFRLVLLGQSSVGKSSLALRFAKGYFYELQELTLGAAFLTQTVVVDDSTTVKFEIWDTAGQERYNGYRICFA